MQRYFLFVILIIFSLPVNAQESNNVICGDARLDAYLQKLKSKNVALVINQTARIGNALLLDTLLEHKIHIVKIFVPEHGLRGKEDAGATIDNETDKKTGIPIISLYGKNKKPTLEQMKDVDIVVYDLQDVGVRFYTYISTLQYVMEACAESTKELMILDRPNPNGFYVDGPVLDTSFHSFVGMQPIPVVYGMTSGEYAKMLVGEKWFAGADKLKMTVIACKNYDHSTKFDLPLAPSPNLKTMTAVYLYASLCFFEGTVVSVGRGTDIPFQQWGNPEYAGKSNYSFVPMSNTGATKPLYEGKACFGQLVANSKEEALEKTQNKLNLEWLLQAYKWYPEKEQFFNNFFEKLSGSKDLKEAITAGRSEQDIRKSWQKDIDNFKRIRKKYLIYTDFE